MLLLQTYKEVMKQQPCSTRFNKNFVKIFEIPSIDNIQSLDFSNYMQSILFLDFQFLLLFGRKDVQENFCTDPNETELDSISKIINQIE